MSLYRGVGSDERKLNALVFVIIVILLIGHVLNVKHKHLIQNRGVVLTEDIGKGYDYFYDRWGEPVLEEEKLYKEGLRSSQLKRFKNNSIDENDTVSYTIWKCGEGVYVGACFVWDRSDEWRAVVVLELTTDQVFGNK